MMNFRDTIFPLGRFEIKGKLRVTDPCYKADIWCAGALDAVSGTWEAGIIYVNNAVAVLAARHESSPLAMEAKTINFGAEARKEQGSADWAVPAFRVCVDSGQAGLFDDASYSVRNGRMDEDWYEKVCNITLSDTAGGVLEDGAVSRAGYGDGGYACVYHKNEAELADFVFLLFMDDKGNEDL